jgi:hypothetical protein
MSNDNKRYPVTAGVLDYFPDAIKAVAEVSQRATLQHHADHPMHWDRAKSPDEADALVRHLMDRGKLDTDGLRHTAKVAWRALALLQKELEAEEGVPLSRASKPTTRDPLYKQADSAAQQVNGHKNGHRLIEHNGKVCPKCLSNAATGSLYPHSDGKNHWHYCDNCKHAFCKPIDTVAPTT